MLGMPFKISFRKEMLKHSGRSAGWISLLYLIVLIFTFPLTILMTVTNENRSLWPFDSLFNYNYDMNMILIISTPVLLAIFLFRFLNVKESSDLFHSLPVKREQIFHQYTITGLLYLIIPVLITALLLLLEHRAFDLENYFSVGDIIYWAGVTIILNTIIYMGAVFVGMFTGISFVHGVLSYIFLLLPAGLIVLVTYNLQFFLYGFPEDYFINNQIEIFSPLVLTQKLTYNTIDSLVLWSYGILSVLLYVLALYVYKKRKAEAVSHAIVFPILKPVFTFGTMLCTAFLAALYFGETQNHSLFWLIFGYVTGSLVGFLAAQMVLNKTWRVFGNLKSYAFYAAGMLIVILMLHFDVMQYEKKIPDIDEIKQVHLSNRPYIYYGRSEEHANFLKSKENIQRIQELHQAIITDKIKEEDIPHYKTDTAFIVYELKNGNKLVREYLIDKTIYKTFYEPIHESEEYKLALNEIFHRNTEEMKLITIQPPGPVNRRASFSNPEEIEEFVAIVKEEILSESYDEMNNSKGFQSYISILLEDNYSIDFSYKPSYQKLTKWLEEKGVAENATASEEDISYAVIIKKDELNVEDRQQFDMDIYQFFNKKTNSVKITNKAQIKKLMNQSIDSNIWEPEYQNIVAFYYKNNERDPYIRALK
jgi:ABC-2 type transport system permease protein